LQRKEFSVRGFRWLETTELGLPDGSTIRVSPSYHRSSDEKFAKDARDLKILRVYFVQWPDGRSQEQTELEIERMIEPEATAAKHY